MWARRAPRTKRNVKNVQIFQLNASILIEVRFVCKSLSIQLIAFEMQFYLPLAFGTVCNLVDAHTLEKSTKESFFKGIDQNFSFIQHNF